MSTPARTDFTRKADRGSHERAAADAVLAEALVGHLGFIDASGLPVVLPVAVAPDGERTRVIANRSQATPGAYITLADLEAVIAS